MILIINRSISYFLRLTLIPVNYVILISVYLSQQFSLSYTKGEYAPVTSLVGQYRRLTGK